MAQPRRRPQRSGAGGPRRRRFDESEKTPLTWTPKTRLGRMVKSGEITSMSDALKTGLPLREPEIVDILLPDVTDEVIDVKMVQRMTDSGRRVKFVITVAVGNSNGFVGLGQAKGKEVGMSIKRAIENAKLNMIEIRRGCGSWECRCRTPHTIPFQVRGKSGSVEVVFKPAPRGIGLATGEVAKKILQLAGVNDCWAFTEGKTKTVVNYAKSVYDALKKNTETRITETEIAKLGIIQGSIAPKAPAPAMEQPAPTQKEG